MEKQEGASMEQRPQAMNKGNMIGATERAQQRVRAWIEKAEEVAADTSKRERIAALQCKACFYASRLGGAAITCRPCMSCGSRELYGSTATDVLCAPCATAGDLCKCCGGDRELRARRKAWPVAYSETPNVGAKRATTVGRQARAGENVPRTTSPGLVACRRRSA